MSHLSKADVLAIYDRVLDHAKTYKDSRGNGNDDPVRVAFHGLRTEVHAALQIVLPAPGPNADDGGDPDLHWARQKVHGKGLWKEADAIIADAGVTEKGRV